jgi:gliding motility-associated-like protein
MLNHSKWGSWSTQLKDRERKPVFFAFSFNGIPRAETPMKLFQKQITKISFVLFFLSSGLSALCQNCEVDFPGTAIRYFSSTCVGASPPNLTLGKNSYVGNGDIFTFNLPVVNITGNLEINAQGNGKIIIPTGVTVNVGGNFQINSKNSGCTLNNPCTFEIVVNGTLNIDQNFQNNIVKIIWSGSGDVVANDNFENSSNGCMSCGSGGCPTFDVNTSDCLDNGSSCAARDFCTTINVCSSDTTKPVIAGCPSNQTVNSMGSGCVGTATWIAPTASDNCTLSSITSNYGPGYAFPYGTTTVTYTAADAAGNVASCSFNVTVADNIPPVINGCPTTITVIANASCQAVVNWTAPTLTDNCPGATLISNKTSGSVFSKGTTAVIYTATDAAGNTTTCSFVVTVVDNVVPVITGCPSNITVNANATCKAAVTWTAPTATDNCDDVSLTSSHDPGDTFPIGETPVKYTATDRDGNVSVCVFDVVVKNESLPIISDCPSDIALKGDEAGTAIANWIMPTASVRCGEVTVVGSHQPGDLFTLGTSKVEYTAVDDTGNTSYCNFSVNVSPAEIEIDISKVITPDGDGVSDEWILKNIEKFKDNDVVIVDRWGGVVFKGASYNNRNVVWRGTNRNGEMVPTGTYFYTISVRDGADRVEKSGFIELVR